MTEETLKTILISLGPALLIFIGERAKLKAEKDKSSEDSKFLAYDKQKDWIEKIEGELEERDAKVKEQDARIKELEAELKAKDQRIYTLECTVRKLEERINQMEGK